MATTIPGKIERFSIYVNQDLTDTLDLKKEDNTNTTTTTENKNKETAGKTTPNSSSPKLWGTGDQITLPDVEYDTETLISNDFLGSLDMPCYGNLKSCKMTIPLRRIVDPEIASKIIRVGTVSLTIYGVMSEIAMDGQLIMSGVRCYTKSLFQSQKTGSFKLGKSMDTEFTFEVLYLRLSKTIVEGTIGGASYQDILSIDRLNQEIQINGKSLLDNTYLGSK